LLYYTSTTVWGWAIDLPRDSPVLASLAADPDVCRVAGLVHDLPIRAGKAPIFPYTGFAPPLPHPLLELATRFDDAFSSAGLSRLRRYGVTHGIWDRPADRQGLETLLETSDPMLDRLVYKPPGAPEHPTWRIVRYPEPYPQARVAIRVRVAPDEQSLASGISFDSDPQAVWYGPEDRPLTAGPRASSAKVVSWDGRTAHVEHDGSCDLVISRTYYPGWMASINDGPEQPVARAEVGVQAVRLVGNGPSRVSFSYRPTHLRLISRLSIGAVILAGLGLLGATIRLVRGKVPPRPMATLGPSISGAEPPAIS